MAIKGFDKAYYLSAKLDQLQNDTATAAEWDGKDEAFLEEFLLDDAFGLTAEAHYEQYGYQEGLAPNALFNSDEYIRAKAVQMVNDTSTSYTNVAQAEVAFVEIWGGNVYLHYLQYGEKENVNPSNDFDVSSYLDAKLAALQADPETAEEWADKNTADLTATFEADNLTALEHFLAYGQAEGLEAPAVPADERVEVDEDESTPGTPGGVEGDTFWLTANGDTITGTENDDTFRAPTGTVNFANGNTLNSGDVLDGGAGNDTLVANLINDGFFQSGLGAVRPTTENVENVIINAIETANEGTVTLNAADMLDVENVWSRDSNANLVIQDITTKTSNDGVRNTEALTFRMDHTSNANTGTSNQSDLTVYFDENYLLAGEQSEFSIQLRIVNNFQLAEDEAPLSGFQTVTFYVGDQEVVVDITDAETYQQVADAINAELAEQGISGVQASPAAARTSVFSDDVPAGAGYVQGEVAGTYLPVNIVSTTEPLTNGPIELESNLANFDGLNTWIDGDSTTTDDPITTNVELHKAGRGDEGGDFHVGGKAGGSIAQFNVAVLGADEKPSDIGWLSTGQNQGGMQQVNIATHGDYVDGDSYASLTIRNGFGNAEEIQGQQSNLLNVDANGFLGDLTIGSDQRINNVEELTATGGGDVTYYAENLGGRASDSSTTSVTTGAGDDLIDVALSGSSSSGSTFSTAEINAGNGDNTVVVSGDADGTNIANVTTGSGNDTVYGGATNLTVDTGAGDDAIYAENTGAGAVVEINALDDTAGILDTTDVQFLYGRQIQVTLATSGVAADGTAEGFESALIDIVEGGARLSTIEDLNNAIVRAINEDSVLSKLAVASVDSNNIVTVQYLADGLQAAGAVEVAFFGANSNSDLAGNAWNTIEAAYRDQVNDSTANVVNLYNAAVDTTPGSETTIDSADADAYNAIDFSSVTLDANSVVEVTVGDTAISLEGNGADAVTVADIVAALTANGIAAVEDTGGVNIASTEAISATVNGTDVSVTAGASSLGVNSAANANAENTINAGSGNDVIVLSSDAGQIETIELEGNFGTNSIVHFEEGSTGDVLDFTFYGVVYGTTGTTVGNDYGVVNNQVNVVTGDFDTLDEASVIASITAAGGVASTVVNSIVLVQNTANDGEYMAFDVNSANGTTNFTVDLIGVLDFGAEQTFDAANFA